MSKPFLRQVFKAKTQVENYSILWQIQSVRQANLDRGLILVPIFDYDLSKRVEI